ncbi:MAG: hypothetical protein ACLTJG_15320 [[Clostridium] innocuum]
MKKLQLKNMFLRIAYMIPVVVAGVVCLGFQDFWRWIFRKERLRQR